MSFFATVEDRAFWWYAKNDGIARESLRILLVEDDVLLANSLTRIVRTYAEPIVAGTVREATRLLASANRWRAFFIDLGLPDGSGLEVLARARTTHPLTPAMILTGAAEPEAINAAHDLHADYVVKPPVAGRIDRFLRSAASFSTRLTTLAGAWAERYALSEAEADIVRRSALGEGTAAIAAARDSSRLTVKKQVSCLLRKTGDSSLHAAVYRLVVEAADGDPLLPSEY